MIICEYCKLEAAHTFKNGIHCCSKNVSGCPEIRARRENTAMVKYGDKNFKNHTKAKKTKLTRYGDENYNNRQQAEATTTKMYGVSNVSKIEDIKVAKQSTFSKNYPIGSSERTDLGNTRAISWKSNVVSEITDKIKTTCADRYGVDNPNKNPDIVSKRKQTNLARYGQQPGFGTEKFKNTIRQKYGVENVSQLAEIHERQQRPNWKSYTLPSGKIIKVQGYENLALDALMSVYDENDVITVRKEIPAVWYEHDNIRRRYYPDMLVVPTNTIIEVKSEYIFKNNEEVNMKKKDACLSMGLAFEFWIYESKTHELRKLIYPACQ